MLLRNEWDDDIVSSDDFWEMNDELTVMFFYLWNECGKFAFDWYDFWKLNEVILFLTGMIFEKLNEVIMFLTGMIFEKLNEVIMFWYCWEKCSNQQC